jgi:hypothetical protein
MEFDYKAAGFWFDVLQWLSIAVVAVWGYLRSKDSDNAKAVAALAANLATFQTATSAQITDLGTRQTRVEERLEHMPTQDDQAEIQAAVSKLDADVHGMKQLLERVEHQTNLIHDHLLNKR